MGPKTTIFYLSQELFGGGVGEAEASRRELEPDIVLRGPAPMDKLGDLVGPILAKVETSGGVEELPWPAGSHPEPKSSGFAGALQRGKGFARFDGSLSLFQLLTIERRIGPVPGAYAIHVLRGAGTKADVFATAPIIDIVPARASWKLGGWRTALGEVGNLILGKSGGGRSVNEGVVHGASEVFVQREFACLKLREEGSILFVNDFVT